MKTIVLTRPNLAASREASRAENGAAQRLQEDPQSVFMTLESTSPSQGRDGRGSGGDSVTGHSFRTGVQARFSVIIIKSCAEQRRHGLKGEVGTGSRFRIPVLAGNPLKSW